MYILKAGKTEFHEVVTVHAIYELVTGTYIHTYLAEDVSEDGPMLI